MGSNDEYNLGQNFTIEVFFQIADNETSPTFTDELGLISKGLMDETEEGEGVPYALWIGHNGRFNLTYQDENGVSYTAKSAQSVMTNLPYSDGPHGFYRLAVTKERISDSVEHYGDTVLGKSADGDELYNVESVEVSSYDKITFHVMYFSPNIGGYIKTSFSQVAQTALINQFTGNYMALGTTITSNNKTELVWDEDDIHQYQQYWNDYIAGTRDIDIHSVFSADPSVNTLPLVIGEASNYAGQTVSFQGIISEVRLWDRVLEEGEFGEDVEPGQANLVGYWNFEEGSGEQTSDLVSNSPVEIEDANWVKNCLLYTSPSPRDPE